MWHELKKKKLKGKGIGKSRHGYIPRQKMGESKTPTTATPDQKNQLTIPQTKLCHVPGFSHSGEKQVCITHISHWSVGPASQITPTECKEKTTCTHKNNPHLPEALKTRPKPRKACWTYHHQAKLLLPCLHLSSALCTLTYGHHLLSHILRKVSLSNKDELPQESYPILCVCHGLTYCKILLHFAHYIISSIYSAICWSPWK